MITYFGFNNFFSFKEGAEISFLLDKRLHETIPNHNGLSYVMGIKGANGSGKTNIIRAIGFIAGFIKNSADYNVDDLIDIDSFFNNKKPSNFTIEFYINDVLYRYTLTLDSHKIFNEKLTRKSKREVVVFERIEDKILDCIKSINEIKKIKLKPNSSVIGLSRKFNFESSMDDLNSVYEYFKKFYCNVNYSGLSEDIYRVNFSGISEIYSKNQILKNFMVDFLKSMDDSLIDIKIIKDKPEGSNEYKYYPLFFHEYNGKKKSILAHDESSGTKTLYKVLSMYWITIEKGGFLALDEFDIHLHAMILPKILELFETQYINKNNAQFLFTAHNTEIMDYLGKHRTILVNRDKAESYCYRLDEIPNDILPNNIIRSDRKISGLYLKKKLGGVPNL